jgi:hypothetical protein
MKMVQPTLAKTKVARVAPSSEVFLTLNKLSLPRPSINTLLFLHHATAMLQETPTGEMLFSEQIFFERGDS